MSYGTNAPQGLQPSQYLNGTPWSGQTSEYAITSGYANSLFCGDPVYVLADGSIGIAAPGDGNPITGVFFGVKYTDASGNFVSLPYWIGGTHTQGDLIASAAIVDDPNVLYDIQTSAQAGIGLADINANANLVTGAGGSTRTGQSSWALDPNLVVGATTTSQVKIMRFTPRPGNIAGLQYNNVLVLINNNPLRSGGTGSRGV